LIWFQETYIGELVQRLDVETVVHMERTAHQQLVIFDSPMCGRVLALDGAIQTTERDEFVYHEMLIHVPLIAHGTARRVLIIGGGDGGALEEALKHPVEQVTVVELDRHVVELSRRYLRCICGAAFDDPRAEVVIADGAEYVARTGDRYDVIVVDSTDPEGPAEVLFAQSFYANCRRCLAQGGILVTQNGVPWVQRAELLGSMRALGRLFVDATAYVAPVPTYNGGFLAYGWGTDEPRYREVTDAELQRRFTKQELGARYYNPQIHRASFALPTYISEIIEDANKGR